jgi:hypothetical protein
MTAAGSSGEHIYRRVLWAYPSAYRRRHGDEILTTLLDMADDGHVRLTFRDGAHLVVSGLRQRLRVPRRPLTVIAAVLAAVVFGGLGGVTGNWLGWRTTPALPSTDEAGGLASAITGLTRPSVEEWRSAMNGPGVIALISGTGATYDAAQVRAALADAGWRIDRFTELTQMIVVDVDTPARTTIPALAVSFAATKDGLTLTGTMDGPPNNERSGLTSLRLDINADASAAIVPMTVAGLALGALGGWMLAAAVAYRVRTTGRRPSQTVAVSVALAAAVLPAFVAYCEIYEILIYDARTENHYITYGLDAPIPAVATAVSAAVAAIALVLVLFPAGGRTRPPEVTVSS